jgi:hypothetical protein
MAEDVVHVFEHVEVDTIEYEAIGGGSHFLAQPLHETEAGFGTGQRIDVGEPGHRLL